MLWRGSRDGFEAQEFRRRCDGHASTLTVILDTEGNIFGGFTPMKWESRVWNRKDGKKDNHYKADDSLKSFLFTLKNPHNIPARRFALKTEKNPHGVQSLVILVVTAAQTLTVTLTLAALTPTTLEWTRESFSRVRTISKPKKSKSSRSQPKQHFTQIFFF
jgi:hypothetical protein